MLAAAGAEELVASDEGRFRVWTGAVGERGVSGRESSEAGELPDAGEETSVMMVLKVGKRGNKRC